MKINLLSQSELARQVNLPPQRLAAILRDHDIEPNVTRGNLNLFNAEQVQHIHVLVAEWRATRTLPGGHPNNVLEIFA